MKAVLCPVCGGSGKLIDDKYQWQSTSAVTKYKECHGCFGRGWVSVEGRGDYLKIKELETSK